MRKRHAILVLAILLTGCSRSEESSVVEEKEKRIESTSEVTLFFVNSTTQPLAVKTEEEMRIFEIQERGNLLLPDERMPTLSIARKDQGEAKLIFQARVYPSSTVTAYEDSSGTFRVRTDRN